MVAVNPLAILYTNSIRLDGISKLVGITYINSTSLLDWNLYRKALRKAEIDLHALAYRYRVDGLCRVISPPEAQHIGKQGQTNSGNL